MTTETDEWPPRRARSMEDWDAYWARQRWDRRFVRKVVKPKWARFKRRLAAPKRWRRELIWGLHRARHGWADTDWWDFDGYITQLVGEVTARMREKGHGHPCLGVAECYKEEVRCDCEKDWDSILADISGPLLAYKTHWDWPDGMEVSAYNVHRDKIITEAQAAMHLLADNLGSLWD